MRKICSDCWYNDKDEELGVCYDCIMLGDDNFRPKVITRYDQVRKMSIDEMAELFCKIEKEDPDVHLGKDGWLEWLREEIPVSYDEDGKEIKQGDQTHKC